MLEKVDRNTPVLDVGCGTGGKMRLLRDLGFTDLTGVDINEYSVKKARQSGFSAFSVEEFEAEYKERSFGLIVLSHVIEHFCPKNLPIFLDKWLTWLGDDGVVLIATPLPGPDFYKDFDHFKPYFPEGLLDFYSRGAAQVGKMSATRLDLKDIRFRKSPFKISLARELYLKKNDLFFHAANIFLVWIFYASFGGIGRKDAWIGLFEKKP